MHIKEKEIKTRENMIQDLIYDHYPLSPYSIIWVSDFLRQKSPQEGDYEANKGKENRKSVLGLAEKAGKMESHRINSITNKDKNLSKCIPHIHRQQEATDN